MTTTLNAARISELHAVLGAEQRAQLFSALESQATEARQAITQLFDTGQEQSARRQVHRLKGAAQIIGADSLIAVLGQIEACQAGAVPSTLLDALDAEIQALLTEIGKLNRETIG